MTLRFYLFDYEEFIDYARPFIAKAKSGHYAEVIQHAQQIAHQKFSKDWVLEAIAGETINGFTDVDVERLAGMELSHQTGFSLLVIFSQFLERLDYRFTNLEVGLVTAVGEQFGWIQADLQPFSQGLNYPTLLGFEDVEFSQTTDVQWHNPEYFWLWFRPHSSFSSGWWNVDKLKHLQKLSNLQVDFTKINIKKLNFSSTIDELTIRVDFALMKELVSYAINNKKSVYFINA